MRKKPFLRLTKKQRESVKTALDNRIFGCGLAIYAKQYADGEKAEEYNKTFMQGMNKYHEIVNALQVLGVTIDGHEPSDLNA